MTIRTGLLVSLLIITFTGCIINPIFKDWQLIELPEIEGKWSNISTKKRSTRPWNIQKQDGKKYLIDTGQGQTGMYLTRFVVLNDIIYADAVDYISYLTSIQKGVPDDFKKEVIHNIFQIELTDTLFKATQLDLAAIEEGIKSGEYDLQYKLEMDKSSDYNMGEMFFVTATTESLQDFIIKHEKNEKLFPKERQFTFKKRTEQSH